MKDLEVYRSESRGWLFCLNAPLEPGSGSKWGYLDYFYSVFQSGPVDENGIYRVKRTVWGKPTKKNMRLKVGDGVVFYHGKKARQGSTSPASRRHVNPYQLSLIAKINSVKQDEETGEVKELELSYSREIFDSMRQRPLLLDDERLTAIVESSGLGKGPTGAFFPIASKQWSEFLKIASSKYPALSGDAKEYDSDDAKLDSGDESRGQFVDQFSIDDVEPRRENFEGSRFHRDPAVRRIVLERAGGRCELCGSLGFRTQASSIYLETHHIVPLSEGGADNPRNVIALCPNHHRKCHYAEEANNLRFLLARKISNI